MGQLSIKPKIIASDILMLQFGSGLNKIIAMNDGVSLKYMFTDALGSVTAVYDAATSTVEFTTYDAYGNRINNKLVTVPYYG